MAKRDNVINALNPNRGQTVAEIAIKAGTSYAYAREILHNLANDAQILRFRPPPGIHGNTWLYCSLPEN